MTHNKEKRKAMEEVYLCSSGGYAGGWCDRRGFQRTGGDGNE